MNTEMTTDDSITSSDTVATAGRRCGRRGLRRRTLGAASRRLAVAAILAVPAVGASVAVLPASPAAASFSTPYYVINSTVTCNSATNTALVNVYGTPQPGYSSVWVSIRQYVQIKDGRTTSGGWTPWSSATQLGLGRQLQYTYLDVGEAVTVNVYTEVMHWTNSGWSTPQGSWASTYQAGSAYPYSSPTCQTWW